MVGCHLTRGGRRHLVESLHASDVGHVNPRLASDAHKGRDGGLLGDLRSCGGVALGVPRFLFHEFSRVLRVDGDELPFLFGGPKNLFQS